MRGEDPRFKKVLFGWITKNGRLPSSAFGDRSQSANYGRGTLSAITYKGYIRNCGVALQTLFGFTGDCTGRIARQALRTRYRGICTSHAAVGVSSPRPVSSTTRSTTACSAFSSESPSRRRSL